MRRFTLFAICAINIFNMFAQSDAEKIKTIKQSVEMLMSCISDINEDEDGYLDPSTIQYEFGGANYFIANGKDAVIADFFRNYSKRGLDGSLVYHIIDWTYNSVTKSKTSRSDNVWNITATLKRQSGNGEDFLVKDTPINLVVRFNGIDKNISLLEINFPTSIEKIYPRFEKEYYFKSNPSRRNVEWSGGQVNFDIDSRYRNVKIYSTLKTIPEETWYRLPFSVISSDFNYSINNQNNTLTGEIKPNYSKSGSNNYKMVLKQEDGLYAPITIEVYQGVKPKTSPFEFDSDIEHQIELFYSLKYQFGLSYTYVIPDSRWTIGVLAAMNNNTFKATKPLQIFNNKPNLSIEQNVNIEINVNHNSSSNESDNSMNGYIVGEETEFPTEDNYSSIFDPNNNAKHYTSRQFCVISPGFFITNWMRFDLGLGIARARDLHYMENVPSITRYSYTKTDPALPDIDDVVVYSNYYKTFWFNDKQELSFALRPALNFQIPLGKYRERFLTGGIGYTYTPSIKNGSSMDFTFGFGFEL